MQAARAFAKVDLAVQQMHVPLLVCWCTCAAVAVQRQLHAAWVATDQVDLCWIYCCAALHQCRQRSLLCAAVISTLADCDGSSPYSALQYN